MLAGALARIGDPEAAREALVEADLYATCAGSNFLNAEVGYFKAVTAWTARDFATAERIAFEALDESAGTSHARLLELLALAAGMRGNSSQHIALLQNAIGHLERLETRDVFLEANMLNNLAIPASETNAPGLRDFISTRLHDIPWHEELLSLRFHVTRHLAWLDALTGDHLSAFRRFRAASDMARGPAWKIFALTDRAYLAREMGEALSAAESVADAEELVANVDWKACEADEARGLLMLATLVAPSDPARAAGYVERYTARRKKMDPTLMAAHSDPLHRARELHALALVEHADHRECAERYLREAHRLFIAAGSRWRAAVVALDIYERTGDENSLRFARDHADRIPQSWLARRISRHFPSLCTTQQDAASPSSPPVEARMNVA
ncbi:MAG: hypothetical protein ABR591_02155 [Candidatus Velthaea sp.]